MNLTDLRSLVAGGESSTLELKKSTAEKERACRTLCAFANSEGGQVIFGVTPAGKIVGQAVGDRTLEELAAEFNGFEPPLLPRIERIPVADDRELIRLHVEKPMLRPVSFRGVPYERALNTTRVMPRATYQRLMLESLHATDRWETQAAAGWTIDKLDNNEIVVTLEESIRRGRSDDPGSRDPLAILRGFGLLIAGNELTRAAVALFCKGDIPQPDFPQLHLRVARFKGADRSEFLDNRQFHGNAFDLMRRAERFLIDWLPVASRIVPGKFEREDSPLFPIEALREALANAFVHRDYASGSGSIGVALYDDRLEIISPGELHFGLTPEKLLLPHESKPWNPLIASAFYRRGITEKWGRGTLKIAELMIAAGQQAPLLVSDDEFVMVTFTRPDKYARGSPAEQVTEQVTEQVGRLVAILQGKPLASREAMKLLGLQHRPTFIYQYLQPAIATGLVEMTQPASPNSPSQKYRLTGKGVRRLHVVAN
jgi:ATP-dependent DNA helicase RecG